MKEYVCLYSVQCENHENEIIDQCGIFMADSFQDAARTLEEELYQCCLVKITNIELFDACPVFSPETVALLRKELTQYEC